jgi:hypothetical protein
MEQLEGTFEITEQILSLSLPDGRCFTISFQKDSMTVHDVSWNRHFQGESRFLNRESIMAIQHTDMPYGDGLNKALFKFIDVAGVPSPPPPPNDESAA